MILLSQRCRRYYHVMPNRSWRFLPTKQAQAVLMMAAWQRCVQAPRGAQVKRNRIEAEQGRKVRPHTLNQERAARVAHAFGFR